MKGSKTTLSQASFILDVSGGMQESENNLIGTSSSVSSIAATSLNDKVGSLWTQALSVLRTEIDSQVYAAYVSPLTVESFDAATVEVVISAPSKLVSRHVEQHFKARLETLLQQLLGASGLATENSPVSIRFSVQAASNVVTLRPALSKRVYAEDAEGALKRRPSNQPQTINPRYTFANFVVGNSNQFCHAAAMRVAENPGQSYNPLFIYGGVGLGKTHLMHAIGNAVLARNPEARIAYMSSETFTNELINALRYARMEEFKKRMRSIEVLLIDDIQFMCGKERTQEEFFHTFNALYNAKHQIVLTSDKLPQEIPGIEERLRTRFSWGLTADLQAPDFETRVAILKRKASIDGFELPQDVAHYIAEHVSSNVRELEGVLTRVHAVCSLQKAEITLQLAEHALKPMLQPKKVNITVDDIKREVAQHAGIKVSEMVSKRRTKNLSFPRHIAMYLCRKHTTCSYPEIGGHFGGRDHSSVIHAANVVATKIENNPEVKNLVAEIERRLLE